MSLDGESPIHNRHLWEELADQLRQEIHSGALAPGTRLVTADLAGRWGVSRGPVREALMALENEGIVQSTRRHGTVVGTPSALDLQEIYSLREAIDVAAGTEICTTGMTLSAADVQRLVDQLDGLQRAREAGELAIEIKHDFAFHQMLVDLVGNSRFSAIYRQALSQNTQHLKCVQPEVWPQHGWERVVGAHRMILESLSNGDLTTFRSAIALHYVTARERANLSPENPVGSRGG